MYIHIPCSALYTFNFWDDLLSPTATPSLCSGFKHQTLRTSNIANRHHVGKFATTMPTLQNNTGVVNKSIIYFLLHRPIMWTLWNHYYCTLCDIWLLSTVKSWCVSDCNCYLIPQWGYKLNNQFLLSAFENYINYLFFNTFCRNTLLDIVFYLITKKYSQKILSYLCNFLLKKYMAWNYYYC